MPFATGKLWSSEGGRWKERTRGSWLFKRVRYQGRQQSEKDFRRFHMAANILVGVMTAAAVAWLIWAEMNSRRNTARQNATVPVETAEVKSRQGSRNTLRGV